MIRTQAPLIRSVNDDAATWRTMWRSQVRAGMVPYYMFVERDTGPQDYFAVPLARAHEIFRDAYAGVSGLCRSVRGPSMSATPGKVCVDGIAEVAGLRVFVLRMLQARDPSLPDCARRHKPNSRWSCPWQIRRNWFSRGAPLQLLQAARRQWHRMVGHSFQGFSNRKWSSHRAC